MSFYTNIENFFSDPFKGYWRFFLILKFGLVLILISLFSALFIFSFRAHNIKKASVKKKEIKNVDIKYKSSGYLNKVNYNFKSDAGVLYNIQSDFIKINDNKSFTLNKAKIKLSFKAEEICIDSEVLDITADMKDLFFPEEVTLINDEYSVYSKEVFVNTFKSEVYSNNFINIYLSDGKIKAGSFLFKPEKDYALFSNKVKVRIEQKNED